MLLAALLFTAGFDLAYDAPAACPSREEFTAALEAQIGKRVIRAGGEQVLSVRVVKADARYVAVIQIGPRRRELKSQDCDELTQSAATVAAVAIDPQGELAHTAEPARAPTPPPAAAPSFAPSTADTFAAAAPKRRASAPGFRLAGGLLGALAVGPSPALGFSLELGLGWRHFSLNLEANAYVPSLTPGSTAVSSTLAYAALSPCGHASWFVGCMRAGVGGLHGEGIGVQTPRRDLTFYAFVGARAGVEIPVYKVFYIRPLLDLMVPLTRITLALDDRPVWTTPVAGAALSLQALLRIE
jgi:hypothetical protein